MNKAIMASIPKIQKSTYLQISYFSLMYIFFFRNFHNTGPTLDILFVNKPNAGILIPYPNIMQKHVHLLPSFFSNISCGVKNKRWRYVMHFVGICAWQKHLSWVKFENLISHHTLPVLESFIALQTTEEWCVKEHPI